MGRYADCVVDSPSCVGPVDVKRVFLMMEGSRRGS